MSPRDTDKKGRRWIRPLPERLINKIAAGEVVERPASVVKELVENAIDAGATRIEIAADKAGSRLLRIIDNGCGIEADQIEIAFSRHATSKIAEFTDLDRITSYGFRGEALPSIASVSRLRMVSRPAEQESGIEIVFEGGVLQSQQPIAASPGTTIEVENLFFNTPARRKFLKAETTEARHISRVATGMAIGAPTVAFVYHLNGRKVFSVPGDISLGERVTSLLAPGKKFVEINGEIGPFHIEGHVGPPDLVQSNRNSQYLFINGRLIQSPVISHGLAAGFGELLPKGNFPIGALLISVDPTDVDVNVHPTKAEVRLARERELHDAVYRLVKDSLRAAGIAPQLRVPDQSTSPFGASQSFSGGAPLIAGHAERSIPGIFDRATPNPDQLRDIYGGQHPGESDRVMVDQSTGEIIGETRPTTSHPLDQSGLRLIGRFDNLYLLFQSGHQLIVVDQHTAHERVLYEEMLKRMDDQGGNAQHLLLTVQVDLGPQQFGLFEEAADLLVHSGFEVEPFGGTTVNILAVPAILSRKSPEKALRSVLDDVASLKQTGYDLKKAVAQSVACRSAVMAGDFVNDNEAMALVAQLMKCDNRHSCPHGRPTFVTMSREDLDKQFGRL